MKITLQKGFIAPLVIGIVVAVVLFGVGYYIVVTQRSNEPATEDTGSMMQETMMENSSMADGYQGTVIAGSSSPLLDFTKTDYEKARATDKLLVLYFYANWCPICREETENALYPAFESLTGEKIIGFRVNFNDSQTDNNEKNLAREFGVAYQHTKVFLKNGARILKSPESWDRNRYLEEFSRYQ